MQHCDAKCKAHHQDKRGVFSNPRRDFFISIDYINPK